MNTPSVYNVTSLELDADCTTISKEKWDELMTGAKRANKKQINRLVKKHLPELHDQLVLKFYNPYNYFRTDTHFILVHSAIEFFIRYN